MAKIDKFQFCKVYLNKADKAKQKIIEDAKQLLFSWVISIDILL